MIVAMMRLSRHTLLPFDWLIECRFYLVYGP